jgi:hypothetical protein
MRTLLRVVLVLVAVALPVSVRAESPPLLKALVDAAGFTRPDVERIGDDAVAHEIKVADRSWGAAFAGLIRLRTDGRGLADAVDRMDLVKSPLQAHAFGRFENPATLADVAALTFSDSDLEVLADCELRNCKFKLSREGIDSLGSIDWQNEQAGDQFTRAFRKEAVDYVNGYRQKGTDGLLLYGDKSEPQDLGAALARLISTFEKVNRFAPEFSSYLVNYPAGSRTGLTESIIWSVMDFGYRPTLAIDHIVIDRTPEEDGIQALVAAKTIYANHYLAARVQIGILVEGAQAFGTDGHYIVLIDRIRFDDELGGFKRKLLASGLSSNVEDRLEFLRSLADSQ